jgi:hypothetical protein
MSGTGSDILYVRKSGNVSGCEYRSFGGGNEARNDEQGTERGRGETQGTAAETGETPSSIEIHKTISQ